MTIAYLLSEKAKNWPQGGRSPGANMLRADHSLGFFSSQARRLGRGIVAALLIALMSLSASLWSMPAQAVSRIKDIADFEGVRQNQLVGYGLVVGLNGTGDDLKK